MKVVTLVSGGLDSTVMAILIKQEALLQVPVFINYGQRNLPLELAACKRNLERHDISSPKVIDIPGYGAALPSGLTNSAKHIVEDAFLPGRNLLFLLCAAAVAQQESAEAVAIGFLHEKFSLFPDQRRDFADQAGELLSKIMMKPIRVLTPLISMTKAEVVAIASELGVQGTYSCHAGTDVPCGKCIACREYDGIGGHYGRQ
jgi:7-cyano-7-deazaguanine synthase